MQIRRACISACACLVSAALLTNTAAAQCSAGWWWPPEQWNSAPHPATALHMATITMSGDWPDSCAPNAASISVENQVVYFNVVLSYANCDRICLPAITAWQQSASASLPAGQYQLFANLINAACSSEPCQTSFVGTLTVYGAGDMNCDGRFDNFDIDPFVLAIVDADAYVAAYPECDRDLLDVNDDGRADNFDIDPFVALLIGP